jgi:hypothetical protein
MVDYKYLFETTGKYSKVFMTVFIGMQKEPSPCTHHAHNACAKMPKRVLISHGLRIVT